ncbi:MAG: LysR substrate-binding domain-containing protein [Bacteroidales bacterium]|nr:LysR substrate-binding domain-containing protein [Bacteroidales bacterium]
MNIQQLDYIIAVDRLRHFAKAAEACGVTQPTLSMMIQKLEEELEVDIFDRKKSPIEVTPIGKKLISQAKVIKFNLKQFKEIADSARDTVDGELSIAIIPTLAPYIIPQFFGETRKRLPDLKIKISEIRTSEIIEQLKSAQIEVAIASTPIDEPSILELPLFYERFIAYISPLEKKMYRKDTIVASELDPAGMWLLQEGHCFRSQMLNICHKSENSMQVYEAGSIETLIRIVDSNGGYTLLPELHLSSLTAQQKENVRYFSGDEPRREISFVFREDFVKERLINELVEVVKLMIPSHMLDKRLSKFRVKL